MDSVLPPLKDGSKLPSLELSFEKLHYNRITLIYRFEELRPSDEKPTFLGFHRNYFDHFHPSGATALGQNSFYLANQGYYISFGCGSVKDKARWYEWRASEVRRESPRRSHGKGVSWRAWQRCKVVTKPYRGYYRKDVHSMRRRAGATFVEAVDH